MKKLKTLLLQYLFRILPLAYMILIWVLSSFSSDAVVNTGFTYDRAIKESLHLIEFAILFFLLVMALLSWSRLNQKTILLSAYFSVFYGLTDEIHQYFVPSRSATITDLLKDAIGVYIAWRIINKGLTIQGSKVNLLLKRLEKQTKY